MTIAKEFERKLTTEYDRGKETLVSKFSMPLEKKEAKETINATLLLCTKYQVDILLKELPSEYLAGVYIENDYLSRKVPAYVSVDLSTVSKANLNKITRQTIGAIGNFNDEIANELKLRYGILISNNELINQLETHGWTASVENRMIKMGFDKETINLVKQQTTANKMIEILNNQGLKKGMHPNEVSKLLQPHIRAIFGLEGVEISNIDKLRKELIVTGDGKYRWIEKKITRPYHTTVRNYASIISRTSMLRAHNLGRVETLRQSGFVEKYRFIASLTANSCSTCAMLNGQIVEPSDLMPPIHPRCGCYLAPVWKKETGLMNHPDDFFEHQRDKWFWKTHQTKQLNKTLPKEARIENYNFLPKSELGVMPNEKEMYNIRASMLK